MNINQNFNMNINGDKEDVNIEDLKEQLLVRLSKAIEELGRPHYKTYSISVNLRSEDDDRW